MSDKSLEDLFRELRIAEGFLADAVRKESIACSATCDARNAVNDLQKKIDNLFEEHRKQAPRDTEWSRRKAG